MILPRGFWSRLQMYRCGFCFGTHKNTCIHNDTRIALVFTFDSSLFFPSARTCTRVALVLCTSTELDFAVCTLAIPEPDPALAHSSFDRSAGCSPRSCATAQWCWGEQNPAPCDSFPHTISQSAKHICNLLQLVFL